MAGRKKQAVREATRKKRSEGKRSQMADSDQERILVEQLPVEAQSEGTVREVLDEALETKTEDARPVTTRVYEEEADLAAAARKKHAEGRKAQMADSDQERILVERVQVDSQSPEGAVREILEEVVGTKTGGTRPVMTRVYTEEVGVAPSVGDEEKILEEKRLRDMASAQWRRAVDAATEALRYQKEADQMQANRAAESERAQLLRAQVELVAESLQYLGNDPTKLKDVATLAEQMAAKVRQQMTSQGLQAAPAAEAVSNLKATVLPNQVVLDWASAGAGKTYSISRSEGGNPPQMLATKLSQTRFVDIGRSTSDRHYRVIVE